MQMLPRIKTLLSLLVWLVLYNLSYSFVFLFQIFVSKLK